MNQILRTLAILVASAAVIGVTWLITPTAGAAPMRRARPEQQAAASGAEGNRERPERRGERSSGPSLFVVLELLQQTAIIAIITVIFVTVERRVLRIGVGTKPEADTA
jgi:hypothetical protein